MPRERTHRTLLLFLILLLLGALPRTALAATTIKVALVTPEGSTWTRTLQEMAADVQRQTDNNVTFQIYAGGVSGDELDVLRKMRANRIQAAGFSGVGLGVVLPEIRILEQPLLFENDEEIDHVKDMLFDDFAAGFEKKGYVLLGFAEAGFVYFFSQQPLNAPDALTSIKMWVWKGDPLAETFLKNFNIRTYPLSLADVNTGLETGMIDSFYSPPLAAVAFQWYSRIRYMLDYPMVNSTGALLINKRTFYRINEKDREILRKAARQYSRKLVALTRQDNREALAVLAESGVQMVKPTPAQLQQFRQSAEKTYQQNMPSLYSRQLFDRVQQILHQFRTR